MSFWDKIKHFAHEAKNDIDKAGKAIEHEAGSIWKASTKEADDVAKAIENSGTKISSGLIEGAKFAESWAEKGAKIAYESAVDAGKYVDSHACDIAVGSSLSAAFATMTADGEEETAFGSFATLCAASTIDRSAIATAADAAAALISDPLWLIPGIDMGGKLSKNTFRAILAFAIQKCCTENPKLVVGTGGQYIAGALIACSMSLICEGALPGGFKP